MHFEVLVEDKSGSIAVNIVLEKRPRPLSYA